MRFLAGVTLVAFLVLVGGDKICCPDGCTGMDKGGASTESLPQDGPHACALCVLGVEAADLPRSDNPVGLVASVVPVLTSAQPKDIPISLYHPPRSA